MGPPTAILAGGLDRSRLSPAPDAAEEAALARAREEMVASQIAARGVRDPRTLAAMRKVPRHLFVPARPCRAGLRDHPLPIGHGQTISQPYIVAFMTEALGLAPGGPRPRGRHRLGLPGGRAGRARRAGLHHRDRGRRSPSAARADLARLGYANVEVRVGDGYLGWPEQAPFDAIMVTAAAPRIRRAPQGAAQGRGPARAARRRRLAGAGGRDAAGRALRGEARPPRAIRSDDGKVRQ